MSYKVKLRLPESPLRAKYSWAKNAVPEWLATQKQKFHQATHSGESPSLTPRSVDLFLGSLEEIFRGRRDRLAKGTPDERYEGSIKDLEDILTTTPDQAQFDTVSSSPSSKTGDTFLSTEEGHDSFESGGPDSVESIDVWALLRRLADLAQFSIRLWKKFEHEAALDFQIGCVITNLAIREMQRLHTEFISQYPRLTNVEEVHRYLGVKFQLVGQQWRMILPRYLQVSNPLERPLRDILYPASYVYLSSGIATIGKEVSAGDNTSLIGDLDPVSDAAAIAFFTLARVLKSGARLPRQDCLFDGMIDAYGSGNVPTWLPYAFAAYEQVFGMIADQVPRSWHLQQVFFFQASRTILRSPSSPTVPDRGQLQTSQASRDDDVVAFHRLTRVLDRSEKLLRYGMSNEPLEECLKRFPVAACAFGFQSRVDMYLGGLACCNTRYIICLTAHLYQACVGFKLLPYSWKDLEYVLGVHTGSTSGLPLAVTPNSSFNVHDRFKAAFGSSATGSNQGLRLRPQLPLAHFISTSEVQNDDDFWRVCEAEVLRYSSLRSGDAEELSPYNRGLNRLLESLEGQKFEMSFDYVQMAWNCEQFLRAVRTTCNMEKDTTKSYFNVVDKIILQGQELIRRTRSNELDKTTLLWKTSTVLNSIIPKTGEVITRRALNSLAAGSSVRMISIKAKSRRESAGKSEQGDRMMVDKGSGTKDVVSQNATSKSSLELNAHGSVEKEVEPLTDWMGSNKRWEDLFEDGFWIHNLELKQSLGIKEIWTGTDWE